MSGKMNVDHRNFFLFPVLFIEELKLEKYFLSDLISRNVVAKNRTGAIDNEISTFWLSISNVSCLPNRIQILDYAVQGLQTSFIFVLSCTSFLKSIDLTLNLVKNFLYLSAFVSCSNLAILFDHIFMPKCISWEIWTSAETELQYPRDLVSICLLRWRMNLESLPNFILNSSQLRGELWWTLLPK